MPERHRQRIHDGEIGEADQHTGTYEGEWVDGLDSQNEVSDGHDQCLAQGHQREQTEAGEVGLADREALCILGIHLQLEDDHQHEGTDPQGQISKQRGHGAAVGAHWEHHLLLHFDGRGDEGGDLLRIESRDGGELAPLVRGGKGRNIRLGVLDGLLRVRKVAV